MNEPKRSVLRTFGPHVKFSIKNSAVLIAALAAAFYANGLVVFETVSQHFRVFGAVDLTVNQILVIGARYSALTFLLSVGILLAIAIAAALLGLVVLKIFSKVWKKIPDSFRIGYEHFVFIYLVLFAPFIWILSAGLMGRVVAIEIANEVANQCSGCASYVTKEGTFQGRIIISGANRFALLAQGDRVFIIDWQDVRQVRR